ncbi:hypothetical protein [Nocardia transvalensis]|uniref:hypothetical protein n=1 Tax=Nocardia transvalensis TaxID=37333 RepID=UPI001893FDA1|nr:hypothetical protein [Nocardia transvalensis]MBF6331995.1 hypothetical protein [Nocardia transvalensis]
MTKDPAESCGADGILVVMTIAVPREELDPYPSLPTGAAFVEAHDGLVRKLFDAGLRMHKIRTIIERENAVTDEVRAGVGSVLDDLDIIIRDAGLTMLTLVRENNALAAPSRPARRHRMR